jgi:hypothetical protein
MIAIYKENKMKAFRLKSIVFMLSVATFSLFLFTSCATAPSAKPAAGPSYELVKVDSRSGVTQKFILIKPDDPVASVILFAGGGGGLRLGSFFGKPQIQGYSRNFLVRTRKLFADHGFMVSVIDSPSDKMPMNDSWRMGNKHAEDIKAVVIYSKNQADIPVWLVGTSSGSFSAANGAIHLKNEIDGLILTASVTHSRKTHTIYSSHPNGVIDMDLDKITVPTLIASHKDDKCYVTPPEDAPKLKKALVNSPKVDVMYFTGGKRPISKPCYTLSEHGFYGIEEEVVSAISDFIKSNSK